MKNPMRILVISNYYPPLELGGWEQLTYDVAQRLKERGHAVFVLASNYRADWIKEPESDVARLLYLESPDHVHYHPAYILLRRKWERKNITFLTQIVNQFNPDIIFVNGMWNLPVSLTRKAEQILSGKVGYYMASLWPVELDAHTAYWLDTCKRNWRSYIKKMVSLVVKKTLRDSTPRNQLEFPLVICVSAFIRDIMNHDAGIPMENLRVVHNGVELDEFVMKEFHNPSQCLNLLFVGRLVPDKGVHTAIEGFGIFRQLCPEVNSLLTIIGAGEPDYENRLIHLVSANNLENHVTFSGLVDRKYISGIMHKHDILLFPSICPDALARTIQEAMACGLAVIGTDTGGTPEILKDGINGLIFDAGNAVMLAEKIIEINSDRQRMEAMGKAARETVEARFSLERMVDDLEASLFDFLQDG